MLEIKPVKRITVTEQVMEQIAHLITSGQIMPGAKLPNERDLAIQFQVTRGRIREALRALSLLGMITIKAGEGSFVNNQEEPIPADAITWLFHNEINNLDEIYAARKLIESEVYLEASKHAGPEHFAAMEARLNSMRNAKNKKAPELFLSYLDEYDLFMGEISGNRIYGKLMQTIVHLRRESNIKLLNVPGAIDNSIEHRFLIYEAMRSKNFTLVKQTIEGFFQSSKTFYDTILGTPSPSDK
ncbi:FadR/GntR family transcriptional regulator [Paenibacillus radicis (ex Xue et al. 2023)]|uniref:GntR family transcriptional regulator n=1 Tax=Paenibacillus radicis (ex Xue et al. 2023) TaxID=2972489 RepID=A0ABT1YR14_9BACL|nr:GntR family transcriptional regulator [Paenibacillus radicis (ex Xue et al. 2023)]MCR8635629.1 GntR family transcriptional regulator [Paenibacillus radicis (ex Xue et al. 2023)]